MVGLAGAQTWGSLAFRATANARRITQIALVMGLLTSILNPKVAIFYLSVLPQFISPENGSVLAQSLAFGTTQVFIGSAVNLLVTLSAARIALWFASNPMWLSIQRYFMGLVLGGLAVRLLAEQRRGA